MASNTFDLNLLVFKNITDNVRLRSVYFITGKLWYLSRFCFDLDPVVDVLFVEKWSTFFCCRWIVLYIVIDSFRRRFAHSDAELWQNSLAYRSSGEWLYAEAEYNINLHLSTLNDWMKILYGGFEAQIHLSSIFVDFAASILPPMIFSRVFDSLFQFVNWY